MGRTKRIVIVGITNHEMGFGKKLASGYAKASMLSKSPLLGYWKSEDGKDYFDASYPVQIDDDNEIQELMEHYQQDAVLIVRSDGKSKLRYSKKPFLQRNSHDPCMKP